MWLNGLGQSSGADGTGVSARCSRVDCPHRFNALRQGVTAPGGPDADGKCPTGLLPEEGAPDGPLAADEFYKAMTSAAAAQPPPLPALRTRTLARIRADPRAHAAAAATAATAATPPTSCLPTASALGSGMAQGVPDGGFRDWGWVDLLEL